MTVQTVPYALQNASHSAALFRQSSSAAFKTGGILGVGELKISQQASPNMSVILGPGRAKVVGTSVSPPAGLAFTTQAMYDALNDANLTLTVTAANATNPRIDVPYIQVQDSFYSGSSNQAIAGIVAGTPSPTPVAPATPLNAIALQPIAVAANATSIVTANIGSAPSLATLIPVVDTGWIAFPFASGWSSYVPATWGVFSYRMIGSSISFRGVATTTGTSGLMGTMPVGFRIAFDAQYVMSSGAGFANINFNADGTVIAPAPGGAVTVSIGQLGYLVN